MLNGNAVIIFIVVPSTNHIHKAIGMQHSSVNTNLSVYRRKSCEGQTVFVCYHVIKLHYSKVPSRQYLLDTSSTYCRLLVISACRSLKFRGFTFALYAMLCE